MSVNPILPIYPFFPLTFNFLNAVFWSVTVFNFDGIPLSQCVLVNYAFGVVSKNFLPNLRSKVFLLSFLLEQLF